MANITSRSFNPLTSSRAIFQPTAKTLGLRGFRSPLDATTSALIASFRTFADARNLARLKISGLKLKGMLTPVSRKSPFLDRTSIHTDATCTASLNSPRYSMPLQARASNDFVSQRATLKTSPTRLSPNSGRLNALCPHFIFRRSRVPTASLKR